MAAKGDLAINERITYFQIPFREFRGKRHQGNQLVAFFYIIIEIKDVYLLLTEVTQGKKKL
jgi:hypothetical protein